MKFLTVLNENPNEPQEVLLESLVDGSIWKRTGYCNRCGNCCVDIENIFQTEDGNFQPISEPLVQVVPGKCAYFRWDENGLGTCTGRDTAYYHAGCKFLPAIEAHMIEWSGCNYTFEKVSDAQ